MSDGLEEELKKTKEQADNAASSKERLDAFRRLQKLKKRSHKAKKQADKHSDEHTDKNPAQSRLAHKGDWDSRGKTTKDKDTRRRYRAQYYTWLKPYRMTILSVIVMGIIVSGFEMVIPIVTGQITDVVTGDSRLGQHISSLQDWSKTQVVCLLVAVGLVAAIGGRVLNLIRNFVMNILNAQVTQKMRLQLHERMLRLPLGDLHDLKSGGVVSRLSADVDGTMGLLQQALISPVQAILGLVVVTSYLMWLSWQVTTVSLSILIIMAMIYWMFMNRVRPIYRSLGEDRQRVEAALTETFGGIRVVRTFAREHRERLVYGVGQHTLIRKRLWVFLIQSVLMLFWEMLMPLVSLSIFTVGCLLILNYDVDLTVGDLIQFQMLTFLVLNPVFMLVHSITETQRSLASMERVYEILERDPEMPDRSDAQHAPARVDRIEFENLYFAYDAATATEDNDYVIKDFNLSVPGGSVVAFVGASGAGKTTMTDLLARFHDPSKGSITLNGVDLRDYKLAEFRTLLGVVQQEVFLFDGTIRDNISYGLRHAGDDAIEEAARRANALEFIDKLDDRFDSIIGERGVKLSGGQRQRLSIARAILADPKILILDEATSNLDTESEQLIQASLSELFKNRTTFVVAHRLSTIRNADIIVVVEDGRIVQQGKHDELIASGEGTPYYDMVKRQDNFDAI